MSTAQLSKFLAGSLSGLHVSTYREGNTLIEVLLRGAGDERTRLEMLASWPYRRQREVGAAVSGRDARGRNSRTASSGIATALPTITVRATSATHCSGDGRGADRAGAGGHPRASASGLSAGNRWHGRGFGARPELDRGGPALFLMVVVTLLMLQLRSLSRTALVL